MRKLCLEPGCAAPPVYRGRCRTHARRWLRSHRNEHDRIYRTKRWRLTRRHVLRRHPLCSRCGAIATQVHHVKPLAAGGPPYELANLEALCRSCHSKETRGEMAG